MLKPKMYWMYTAADIGDDKWIDVKGVVGGVTSNYTIDATTLLGSAPATFADFMCSLIEALFNLDGTDSWHWSTRPDGVNVKVSTNTAGSAYTFTNLTGGNTAHNFLKTHFKLPNIDIAVNAVGVDGDLGGTDFPSCIWASPVAINFDSQDEFAVDDDAVTKSVSGRMKYMHEAEVSVRMAKWKFLPPSFTRKSKATYPQRTVEGLWRDGRSVFEYWNDQSLTMGSGAPVDFDGPTLPDSDGNLTADQYGRYCLDHDTVMNGFHPPRLGNKELYSWDMGMVRVTV